MRRGTRAPASTGYHDTDTHAHAHELQAASYKSQAGRYSYRTEARCICIYSSRRSGRCCMRRSSSRHWAAASPCPPKLQWTSAPPTPHGIQAQPMAAPVLHPPLDPPMEGGSAIANMNPGPTDGFSAACLSPLRENPPGCQVPALESPSASSLPSVPSAPSAPVDWLLTRAGPTPVTRPVHPSSLVVTARRASPYTASHAVSSTLPP